MGWLLLNQDYKKHGRTDISDLSNDPFVVWQHKYYAPISIFFAWVMPTLVAGFGWGDWKGGLIYAGVLRVVTVQQSSFTINSLGHYLGDQPFDDRRSPRDHWISSLFSLGEGYHNFHHEVRITPPRCANSLLSLHYPSTDILINSFLPTTATRPDG